MDDDLYLIQVESFDYNILITVFQLMIQDKKGAEYSYQKQSVLLAKHTFCWQKHFLMYRLDSSTPPTHKCFWT